MAKKALITGITGQDGSYLTELLLNKGYEVSGIVRKSVSDTKNIAHLLKDKNLKIFYGDLTDTDSTRLIIKKVQPDEIYNLAGQSDVKKSFEIPKYTFDVNVNGFIGILEAVHKENLEKKVKIYQASTSEMFGDVKESPQNEKTPFNPVSPYGVSRLNAFLATKKYKEDYGMFICNGILFNHESPRRGKNFVSKKIVNGIAEIKRKNLDYLELGNLDGKRDWGHSKDYVESMWEMLQKENPEDYVIATGELHSVRDFLEEAFKVAGINVKSNGKEGLKEEYILEETGKSIVKIKEEYFRPIDINMLVGDASKAKRILGWSPKINFKELVKEMMEEELKNLKS